MTKESEQAALLAIAIASALALLKAVVGFLSGALVLLTDALDSATDVFSSLAAYIGIRISKKAPDQHFQFGYYKAESLAALFISGIIVYAAVVFTVKGFHRLFQLPEIGYPKLSMSVALLSSLVALTTYLYLKRIGERHRSQSLVANSRERLKDVWSSLVVFIGIFFATLRIPYVEGAITIVISLLILRVGLTTMKDAVFTLMDVSPDKEVEDRVSRILSSTTGVMNVYGIQLRKAGMLIFGNATIQVRKSVSVRRAHDISDSVEEQVKKLVPDIESFMIHVEPYRSDTMRLLVPLKENKGLASAVDSHFGRARYLLTVAIRQNKIVSSHTRKNIAAQKQQRAGLATAKDILKENIDAIVLQRIGEISFHTLRDNLIEVYKCGGRTAEQVINNFTARKCTLLRKATHPSE
jgi:cation diffusion facilitator family transporter